MARVRFGGETVVAALVLAALLVPAVLGGRPNAPATDTFSATDYRSGGYAAWYALMVREGVTVERFERRADELDPRLDTLISAPPVASVAPRSEAEAEALAAWVRAGGRLILLDAGDGAGAGTQPPRVRARRAGGALDGTFAPAVAALAHLGGARFALPRAGRGETLLLGDRGGAIAGSRRVGRGELVFVSDPHPTANAALARADNARFAYLLARPRRPGGTVAFDEAIHGALVDRTWWQVLSVPVRIALAGGALAGLLALIGGALRLGPVVDARPPREPTSAEFIAAVAALHERSRARAHALDVLAGGSTDARPRGLAAAVRPTDRDLIAAALRARTLRAEHS